MDRHIRLMRYGSAIIYNSDTIRPGGPHEGVQLCPIPVNQLSKQSRSKVEQNTIALAAAVNLMGLSFEALAEVLTEQFQKKGDKVVTENLEIARIGYDCAVANFQPFTPPLPVSEMREAASIDF